MPSIPQSLLWISLVVLWLFVLVPMLVSKRDNVRRTSDVALATRVLNSGRNARLRRPRASAGHHSDPDWKPAADDEFDADLEAELDEQTGQRKRAVVLAAATEEPAESPYLDVDIVDEDSGALPMGSLRVEDPEAPVTEELTLDFDGAEAKAEPTVEHAAEEAAEKSVSEDPVTDDYEYVEDTAGLEVEDDDVAGDPELAESMASARRNRYESKTAQAVSARKYTFRKRMLLGMSVTLMTSTLLALIVSPSLWWLAGMAGAVTVLYLAYLRRQTRIEEQLRRRRAQRMMRSRLGVENTEDGEFDVVPARLRRPGAAVLDIDDEDPIFEHLDYASFARHYDLPRAAGQ